VSSVLPPLMHRRLWAILGFVLVAAVIVSSLIPGGERLEMKGADKLVHAFAYLVLMVWFAGLYSRRGWAWVALGLLVMGLTLELLQGVMHMQRTADPRDMVANAAGVGVGMMLALAGAATWAQRLETWFARK
jgi:VanZ family protein